MQRSVVGLRPAANMQIRPPSSDPLGHILHALRIDGKAISGGRTLL